MKTTIFFLIAFFSLLSNAQNLEKKLDKNLINWQSEIAKEEQKPTIRSSPNFKTPHYYKILKMGPSIIPILIKMKKNKKKWVGTFIQAITKTVFESKLITKDGVRQYVFLDYPNFFYVAPAFRNEKVKNIEFSNIWIYWWETGRKLIPELFAVKYKNWKKASQAGKIKSVKETYRKLRDLGIIILPLLLKKIKSGDKDLIPMFSYLTDNKVPQNVSVKDCEIWWENNKNEYKAVLDY